MNINELTVSRNLKVIPTGIPVSGPPPASFADRIAELDLCTCAVPQTYAGAQESCKSNFFMTIYHFGSR